MKRFIIFLALFLNVAANAQTATLLPGQPAPVIALPNVDGKIVSLAGYKDATGFIVVFTCNTCPYSKAYEQRIIALNKKYASLGFPLLAINPNDPEASPGDSFEKMKAHAKKNRYTFPYLYDKGQAVTALYGAKNTPQLFIVRKTTGGNVIAYTGAIDSDTQNTDPDKLNYAEDALAALLRNEKPAVSTTKAIGCTIRWKKK